MRLLTRKRPAKAAGYRSNEWKGPRAAQSMDHRQRARRIERLLQSDIEQGLGLIEKEASVAIGACNQCVARIGGQRQRLAFQFFRPFEKLAQRIAVQAVKDQHLAA